jgi:hypothetical protein
VTKVAIICLKTHFKTKNKKIPSFSQISKIEKNNFVAHSKIWASLKWE